MMLSQHRLPGGVESTSGIGQHEAALRFGRKTSSQQLGLGNGSAQR